MSNKATPAPKAPEEAGPAPLAVHATAAPPYQVKDGVVEGGKAEGAVAQPPAQPQMEHNPASWMHQRIVNQIVEFEKNLGSDHELGGRFVEGPGSEPLHITNVASWGPDMILFMGQYPDGRRYELIQHYSQVSVLLLAVPKLEDEPRRIGFELMKNFKDAPQPWGDPVS